MRPEDMSKKKRKRRQSSDEYKAEVVRLCQQPGRMRARVCSRGELQRAAFIALRLAARR